MQLQKVSKEEKIVSICMDNMMIDVHHIFDVKLGYEVYLWDNEIITISDRVVREFINE